MLKKEDESGGVEFWERREWEWEDGRVGRTPTPNSGSTSDSNRNSMTPAVAVPSSPLVAIPSPIFLSASLCIPNPLFPLFCMHARWPSQLSNRAQKGPNAVATGDKAYHNPLQPFVRSDVPALSDGVCIWNSRCHNLFIPRIADKGIGENQERFGAARKRVFVLWFRQRTFIRYTIGNSHLEDPTTLSQHL